jgi:hypothetical protein
VGLAIFVIALLYIGKQTGINVGIIDNIMIINDSTVQVDMLIRKNVQEFIKADIDVSHLPVGISRRDLSDEDPSW